MPEPTAPQLTESDVEAIESRPAYPWVRFDRDGDPDEARHLPRGIILTTAERDALIRDWRALSEQVAKFSELADKRHDELCEARRQRDSLAADMATHIRDATAALREQLARLSQARQYGIQLIRDRAARHGDEEGLSHVLEALAVEIENNGEPSEQASRVQCADCFAWFNSNLNHTCRRQVRRNQRRRTAAELTQLEGERD